jgi:RND family efflux transporter MFP subunit
VKYMDRPLRSSIRFSAFAILMSLLGTGCDSHPQAEAAGVPPPVTAAPATPRSPAASAPLSDSASARHFTTSGPLVAEQQADVAAERDGRVAQIAVEIGDHVRKGQLMARLDDRTPRVACDSQRARVASLHAQVAEWEAEQKSGESDLRRADIMRSEKIRSEEDWEHVKYKLDETIAEVARYRAEEAAAKADLEMAQLQLEQSRIVAPFAGVVGRSSVRSAQEVKKGDVLFWITAVAPLHILFTVPESAMIAFRVGAPLELITADYPDLRQPARILRVSPVVDPASGSVQVIGLVDHASPLLKPGMSMQVRLAP